jgi:hypothetical protein
VDELELLMFSSLLELLNELELPMLFSLLELLNELELLIFSSLLELTDELLLLPSTELLLLDSTELLELRVIELLLGVIELLLGAIKLLELLSPPESELPPSFEQAKKVNAKAIKIAAMRKRSVFIIILLLNSENSDNSGQS